MSPSLKLKDFLQLDEQLKTWCEHAVAETFSSILNITPKLSQVVYSPSKNLSHEISGVIGFVHNRMEGTLALGFTHDTSIKLMSQFYNETLSNVDEKIIGGIGELTNIIFGMIKEHYANSGLQFKMCLPVVIVGNNHTVFSALTADRMELHFETDLGPFFLEIMSVNSSNQKGL